MDMADDGRMSLAGDLIDLPLHSLLALSLSPTTTHSTRPTMLASRASLVSRARFVARRRTFATTSTLRADTPSEKICVVPFAQPWADARDRIYIHGLLASGE